MSNKSTPTESSDEEDVTTPVLPDSDIIIDISNGKHIQFNLDPVEWVIVLLGVSAIIWALGNSGLV